jgi:hypothetical protein
MSNNIPTIATAIRRRSRAMRNDSAHRER